MNNIKNFANIAWGEEEEFSADFSILNLEIKNFMLSEKRYEMLCAERYYLGKHDILKRVRKAISNDGELIETGNLPNNRLVDNQYAKLVDQKVNYILSKTPKIQTESDEYLKNLEKIFDKKFFRILKTIGENSLNQGISWLHPFYNEQGVLSFKVFHGYEIIPFWKDSQRRELKAAVRIYEAMEYLNDTKRKILRAEIYEKNRIQKYVLRDFSCVLNESICLPHFFVLENNKELHGSWGKIPLIPFKSGSKEIPLITRVKSLQDGINLIISDFLNNMQRDIHSTILVLKNYDGTDLGEFRRNLSIYGAVKVKTIDGAEGAVETLKVEVNSQNYRTIISLLKHAMIENGGGFDVGDELMKGNPNKITIQSMYTNIDLDANGMENEFQASFEELLWFINRHLLYKTDKDFSNERFEIIFNRNMLVNESELVENCLKSKELISKKTILDSHPFVKNTLLELERIMEEST